jgi:hypothetical protein
MNLANVKGITIPEGAVKALSIGGVKVWEKVSAPAFDKYSWEGVFASMDNGTYATDYAIGDCIPLDLGSEGLINMQIAAFDADNLADGSGKAKITWISKELLATTKQMNPARAGSSGAYTEGTGSIGGWGKCEMRTYLKNTIKPLIATTVASRIATVTKTQAAYDTAGASFTQTTEDDVWIPDHNEVYASGGIYTGLFSDSDSRVKYKVGATSVSTWWLRSAGSSNNFYYIRTSGSTYNVAADCIYGVALGFCTN